MISHRRRMKTFAITIFAALLLDTVSAQQSVLPQPTHSQSGQFICYGVSPGEQRFTDPQSLATNANVVELEPGLLAVSCERIRQAVWRELDFNGGPAGKIYVILHPARSTDDSILITSQPFTELWNYRVDLPDLADRTHYVIALTHVILLDIANRNATTHSAEIPLWLREGLAQKLLASPELGLIPPAASRVGKPANISSINMEGRIPDPLTRTHDVLRANPALAFDELSWPSDADLQGDRGEQFRGSAQLFVARLQDLSNGRASLRNFVGSLSRYFNWQLAFLDSFHEKFGNILDVEKWWAVNVVEFTGRDLTQTWTSEESWRKLDATLQPAVEVRTGVDQLPLHENMKLQNIVRDWKAPHQSGALRTVIQQLMLLEPRLAGDAKILASNYRRTLEDYLDARDKIDASPEMKGRPRPSPAPVISHAISMLNAFDKSRAAAQRKNLATTKGGAITNSVP